MSTATTYLNPRALEAPTSDDVVHRSLDALSDLYHYNHWLYDHIRPYVGSRVCEVGSGTGNITQFLLNAAEVVGLEPYGDAFIEVEQRFAAHDNVRFLNCTLNRALAHGLDPRSFDSILCTNVLEHIADDLGAMRTMADLCDTGGRVAIIVPAHMSIYGPIDAQLGHYRRYTRRSLRRVFEAAGLRVLHSSYLNMPGYFAWGLYNRILRRHEISPDGARRYNRMVPFISAIERLIPVPFGQSVIMAGTPNR